MSVLFSLKNKITRLFSPPPKQSFTFFIPTPPTRKQGYREKEFDKIFYNLVELGFHIEQVQTQANEQGMWVCLIMIPTKKELLKLDLDIHQQLGLDQTSKNNDIILE
jgi:hypothetical protein